MTSASTTNSSDPIQAYIDRISKEYKAAEAFISAMEKMQNVDLGGFYISYSPTNHAGSNFVDLTIIARDGKFLR